ncbi:uncharacterized protein LOC111250479 isoform X2 [Varroa destructor]|uniref:Uncharacterized protein n=1 Tax=Varroa destructor TaxID=109461 RepID=A0A7M7K4K1_VARDE|nr:uncharacterized protein LOC111250479 isoform X2 [Varroa destructor]
MSPPSHTLEKSKAKKGTVAKADTEKTAAVGRCFKGSEIFHRMNFLAQVQHLVSSESPMASNLHAFYGYTLQLLSRKTQSKLHASLKRILCKKCSTPLRPGTNSVKVRSTLLSDFHLFLPLCCRSSQLPEENWHTSG